MLANNILSHNNNPYEKNDSYRMYRLYFDDFCNLL